MLLNSKYTKYEVLNSAHNKVTKYDKTYYYMKS